MIFSNSPRVLFVRHGSTCANACFRHILLLTQVQLVLFSHNCYLSLKFNQCNFTLHSLFYESENILSFTRCHEHGNNKNNRISTNHPASHKKGCKTRLDCQEMHRTTIVWTTIARKFTSTEKSQTHSSKPTQTLCTHPHKYLLSTILLLDHFKIEIKFRKN